jgi:hypothetical protein
MVAYYRLETFTAEVQMQIMVEINPKGLSYVHAWKQWSEKVNVSSGRHHQHQEECDEDD